MKKTDIKPTKALKKAINKLYKYDEKVAIFSAAVRELQRKLSLEISREIKGLICRVDNEWLEVVDVHVEMYVWYKRDNDYSVKITFIKLTPKGDKQKSSLANEARLNGYTKSGAWNKRNIRKWEYTFNGLNSLSFHEKIH